MIPDGFHDKPSKIVATVVEKTMEQSIAMKEYDTKIEMKNMASTQYIENQQKNKNDRFHWEALQIDGSVNWSF